MFDYLVGHLVADFLEHNGIKTVFGIVSVHNIPIMDGITLNQSIRMVMTRGETGAAHMADGLARAGGQVGVVISSTGPGASNTVPGLVEAQFAGTPVLHITGQSATANIGRKTGAVHDVPDQLGMLRSAGKNAYRVTSVDEVLGVLKHAWKEALTIPRGPVSVEIPIDIQRARIARPEDAHVLTAPDTEAITPTSWSIEALIHAVKQAKRPLIWAGGGARDASVELEGLLTRGFGMITSWQGHGVVSDEHPANLGALNGPGSAAVQALYEQADVLLVVGSQLRGHESLDHKLKLPKNLIRCDGGLTADGRNYPNSLFIQGEGKLILQRFLAGLRKEGSNVDPDFTGQVRAAKIEGQDEFRETLGPYKDY